MAVKYTNNAKSTLASGINSSVTSATVADGSIFPALGAGEYFYITFDDGSNNEIAKVTARSGNTLTIVRAQDNTTARAFSTGDSAELRIIAAVLTEIQENIAAKSANQTVYSATAASNATAYNIGVDPGVEANASVFLDGVYQHHDTFSFSGSTLTFDAAPTNGTKIEVVVDNLINLQSSNLTVDTFTATSGQTAFTLSDAPGGEANVLAFIDGVFQNQAAFTLSSNTLTFDTGVVVGRSVTVYIINPVNIGTPSDSTVTSAKLTGNITLPGSLTVGAYDVAFDSPTFFVDHTNSRVGLGTSSPSVPVDIVGETKMSSHLNLPDNAKIKVGTGTDLQLYHDGTHSYIDNNKGALFIRNNVDDDDNNNIILQAKSGEYSIICDDDGAVTLYYDNAAKLATASGGVTVTGTLTATDAATFAGAVMIGGTLHDEWHSDYIGLEIGHSGFIYNRTAGNELFASSNAYYDSGWKFAKSGRASMLDLQSGRIRARTSNATGSQDGAITWVTALDVAADNGNTTFAANVGIKQTDPATSLHIGDGASHYVRIENAGSGDVSSGYQIYRGSSVGMSLYDNPADNMTSLLCAGGLNINAGGSGADLHVASNGNVGIGDTDPFTKLHVENTGWSSGAPYGAVASITGNNVNDNNWGHLIVTDSSTANGNGGSIRFATGTADASNLNPFAGIQGVAEGTSYGGLGLYTRPSGGSATERMRLKSNGAVQLQSSASTDNRKEEVFHTKTVGTSYTDFFSVDILSTHRAVFYEIITFGGDWSGHSAARSYYKGFMSGTTSYSGDGEMENAGTYGSGSHIDWNYTRSGSTVTFQVKLYTGSVSLEAYIRVIGTFSNITLL